MKLDPGSDYFKVDWQCHHNSTEHCTLKPLWSPVAHFVMCSKTNSQLNAINTQCIAKCSEFLHNQHDIIGSDTARRQGSTQRIFNYPCTSNNWICGGFFVTIPSACVSASVCSCSSTTKALPFTNHYFWLNTLLLPNITFLNMDVPSG